MSKSLTWPAGCFVAALSLRIVWALSFAADPYGDELAYAEVAEQMSRGLGFARGFVPETHISPLFPTLHAVTILLGLSSHTGGMAVALLASSSIAPLLFLLVRSRYELRPAIFAGIAAAAHPHLIIDATKMQPDTLAGLLYVWFLFTWSRGQILGASLLLGLAFWTRPEAVLLAPIWLALLLFTEHRERRRIVLATAILIAVAAPWLLFLRAATGELCLTGKQHWVYVGGVAQELTRNRPVPVELMERLLEEIPGPLEHLRSEPWAFVRGYAYRVSVLLGNLARTITLPLLPLVLIGLRSASIRQGKRFFFLPLALLVVLPVGMTHRHHLIPLLPIFSALAALGLSDLLSRFSRRSS